jgi:hypothetical protein
MPLGDFEREVMRALACNRSAESFVAGASVIHQQADSPRTSLDVDLFHDSERALEAVWKRDVEVLEKSGYKVALELNTNTLVRGTVFKGERGTKVDWVVDSPYRFFPPEKDPEMGWRINFWDGATNKVLAHFNRHEFRDFFDILYLHEMHLHLGALVWAAAGKDPGLTPEFIIDWLKRSTRYGVEEVTKVNVHGELDLKAMKRKFLQACEESEQLFRELPASEMGCFYVAADGKPTVPDVKSQGFGELKRHFASLGGSRLGRDSKG